METAANTEPGLSLIGQIAVRAKDIDRATAYYRDQLGMKLLFQAPPGLAFFQCGEVRLMLSKPESAEFDHASSILYFSVADIAVSHETLTKRGVEFMQPPHVVHRGAGFELWMAFFRDSEDNVMALMCEKRV